MSRPISDAWFFQIKAATRDAVVRCGGVIRSGEIAIASKSEVSRWQSVTDPDIITIPAALALEAEIGVPLITSVMASLNGRRLSDASESGDSAACLFRDHADLMRKSAEVQSTMAEALADGSVTPAEAERVDSAARALDIATDQMRKSLASVRAGQVVPLPAARGR